MPQKVTKLVLIFVLIFNVTQLWSQSTPSKVGSTDDNYGINYNNGPAIDRAPNGQIICIWATKANHNNAVLWSSYDELFGIWNTPLVLGTGTPDRTTPTVIADDNSNFHAVWSDSYKLMYAQYNGIDWSTPIKVNKDTLNSNKSSIVIGTDGKIWVAWSTYREGDDKNEWLFVSHSTDNGATWSDPDTLAKDMHPGIVSTYFCIPHLAASSNGKIGVAYRESDTDVSVFWQIYFQEYDGNVWSEPELITTFSDSIACYQASIAYDSKGRLHCAFYTNETDWPSVDLGQIYYTWKDEGGSWSDPIAITAEPTGKADYPAISIGPNDALYVVYLQNSYISGSARLQVFAVTSADRGISWSDTVRISDGTINMALRSASIGKHPRPAGIGGSGFEGGADLLWVQPDASEPDGNAICYGRIPWVAATKVTNDNSKSLPATCQLFQNYPNPFNSMTAIRLQLKDPGHVRLKIYNIRGEEVATIVDKNMSAGSYNVGFNASKLPAAIYYYQLSVNEFVTTRKMIVLK